MSAGAREIPCLAPELADKCDGFDASAFATLHDAEAQNFWFRSRNRVLTGLVRDAKLSKDASFLEIGCGTGFVLGHLSRRFPFHFTGSDAFMEGLLLARNRAPRCAFVQLDATRIPYVKEFDAAGAFDVIEHIDEDEAVLAGLHQSLKPGGRLFLSVPQHPLLWSEADRVACHKRRYTRRELLEKLHRAGFIPERVTSFVTCLLPLLAMSRVRRRASGARAESLEDSLRALGLLLPWWLDRALEFAMRVDEALIRLGVSLPAGGSLLVVARKSAR